MLKTFEPYSTKPLLFFIQGDMHDAELISLKGKNALTKARVILYDSSVHPDLLRQVNPACRMIDMSGFTSTAVSLLITVFYTYAYGTAVRLYSEDSFKQEDVDYARQRHIEVNVVPGIPGALAIPVSQGISPTRRGANESLWMAPYNVTLDQSTLQNLQCAALSGAAVILKTQPENIRAVSDIFISVRGEHEPAALVTVLNSTRGTITSICGSHLMDTDGPVILVIGKIASEKLEFSVRPALNLAI